MLSGIKHKLYGVFHRNRKLSHDQGNKNIMKCWEINKTWLTERVYGVNWRKKQQNWHLTCWTAILMERLVIEKHCNTKIRWKFINSWFNHCNEQFMVLYKLRMKRNKWARMERIAFGMAKIKFLAKILFMSLK